jgi:hypothetical protein
MQAPSGLITKWLQPLRSAWRTVIKITRKVNCHFAPCIIAGICSRASLEPAQSVGIETQSYLVAH